MATNRIKNNLNKKKSPLTSAGKLEESDSEVKEEVMAVVDEDKKDVIEDNIDNHIDLNDEKIEKNQEILQNNQKNLEKIENNDIKTEETAKTDNNFSFIIEKREEPDIKKQKMYNLKLGNIKKVKDLSKDTGLSESYIIDFLIENGMKLITIK